MDYCRGCSYWWTGVLGAGLRHYRLLWQEEEEEKNETRKGVRRLYPAMVHVVHVMKRLLPELYHLCQTISQRHVGKMLVNSATLS